MGLVEISMALPRSTCHQASLVLHSQNASLLMMHSTPFLMAGKKVFAILKIRLE